MDIIQRPTAELIPYARNARTHSEAQVAQIAGSIREFGFRNPVLIDGENGIIAGHGRVLAALKLGLTTLPCIDCSDLSETQKRAFILADNRIAMNAGWDEEMLALELADLSELEVDLEALGFSEKEMNALLTDTEGQEGEDETPELDEENVVSKPGDVWILGKHRIMCGDSTSVDDVTKLLAGVEPDLMVTDPPYGVAYDASWREGADLGVGKRSKGKVLNDDRADWREAWALFPGNIAYVWHGGLHSHTVAESLTAAGFSLRAQIIWKKHHFVMSRGDYHWQHEPCWYAVRKAGHWNGDRKQTTIWEIANNNSFGNADAEKTWGHSTQKPVECMRRPIVNNSSPGQAVYEPFSGSGTTIIAAETTGRCCYAMELHPPYVDMAVRRWQELTGETAVHAESGDAFPLCAA
jgi:DNA modification methylase